MAPNSKAVSGSKRKAATEEPTPQKKIKNEDTPSEEATVIAGAGVIDRRFYPPEMTNERCQEYSSGKLERPISTLDRVQKKTHEKRDKIAVKDAVVHWFKGDLRITDNKGLHLAHEKAKTKGVPLICIYIVSPQDFEAHITSPIRVDFIFRTLQVLKDDLDQLDIPLYVETVEKRKKIPEHILGLCQKWGSSHLYTNIEYEVDELRREALITESGLEQGIAVHAVPDTCVVSPGELTSGSGNQYSVYSPWFRAWVSYLHTHPHHLKVYTAPGQNPKLARQKYNDLFSQPIPEIPANKNTLTKDEKQRFAKLWPAGEHEAHDRLDKFIKERIRNYKDTRNLPAAKSTAVISVHLAAGTLSARTAIVAARDANSTTKLDGGSQGIACWISEVAWRDFYKHVLAHWPYVCMNKPFKPEYTSIPWDTSPHLFHLWTTGQTGYPFIDAAMRQAAQTGYMHNRARMAVASFLAKDLLLDWRLGERYFMSTLIDGDFASNNGGWGFSSSAGVDPQPYFRVFNPVLQGEKFDAEGGYIREWVPELRGVEGKAVHDPYGRGMGKVVEGKGYPRMCVVHKERRVEALARYKRGLGRDTA